ncbi:alpha-E domain-containing protein [Propionibacteriaceae bacterium G1746]|uniref:alpha-E domain-containing protein n=1 Tax=Aestuariimicrobium sp. G57 TaxID=3418485 RepID=UPI003C16DC2E
MLSRIAESMYWIGRYLERAEVTARLLEVHVQTLLEDPVTDEGVANANLLAVLGVESGDDIDTDALFKLLGWDGGSPVSMVSSFWGARESARRSREVVSVELWEAINTTWNMVRNNRLQRQRPADACHIIRERCATIAGLVEATMPHDQGWQFLVLGRNLERIDMTSRIIESALFMPNEDAAWTLSLRSCSAYHAFRLTHQGAEAPTDAAEFLLLDRLFPRSVVFCLDQCERIVSRLEPGEAISQLNDILRVLGAARAELEYRPRKLILEGVRTRMKSLQKTCLDVNDAVASRYFDGSEELIRQAGAR